MPCAHDQTSRPSEPPNIRTRTQARRNKPDLIAQLTGSKKSGHPFTTDQERPHGQ